MTDNDPCEICETEAETLPPTSDAIHQKCPQCGEFKLSGSASALWRGLKTPENSRRLYGWIRDQNGGGAVPLISSDSLKSIITRQPPSVSERADRLLIETLRGETILGAQYALYEPSYIAATYSLDQNDVVFLLALLEEFGYVKRIGQLNCNVRPSGYLHFDELTHMTTTNSQTGFVAMWFNSEMEACYSEGLQVGILEAGYEPIRVDKVEHVNKIDDEIIAHINASKFVIADFTGHRGGVYFEAGYAMGKGLPVFWTCRKDALDDLHFDIRQYNCITWETPEELAVSLKNRIEAVLGKGGYAP